MNPKTPKDIKVLLVEDDEESREEVSKYLEMRVKELYVAKNGKEGLDLYNQYKPDLIISDIKMPLMNGIDMSKEIKAANKYIPIIIITAYNQTEYLVSSIDIGINQFVVKPIIFDKLYEAMRKCLV